MTSDEKVRLNDARHRHDRELEREGQRLWLEVYKPQGLSKRAAAKLIAKKLCRAEETVVRWLKPKRLAAAMTSPASVRPELTQAIAQRRRYIPFEPTDWSVSLRELFARPHRGYSRA